MHRILIRTAVAVFAFTMGLTAVSIFGGIFGTPTERSYERSIYVAPPMSDAEHPACPSRRLKAVPVPPVAPIAPVAPDAPKMSKKIRMQIRLHDGTVRVIESQTEESAEKHF